MQDYARLCKIMSEFAAGKATDLGGGVCKKRLHRNEYRSILVAKCNDYWVLEFLFAKNAAENITSAARSNCCGSAIR